MIDWNTGGLHISLTFSIAFVLGAGLIASLSVGEETISILVLAAAFACGYLALNIGASDVANHAGAAIGSGALPLAAAIAVAILATAAGAFLAGDSVILTMSRDIVSPAHVGDGPVFVITMISALIAAAVWLNISAWLGFQVSTTHAIIASLLGAAVTAAGVAAVDWAVAFNIALSWLASPVIGGVISALFLLFIEKMIFSQADMRYAARRWIPVLFAIMVAGFTLYIVKNSHIGGSNADLFKLCLLASGVFAAALLIMKRLMMRISADMLNRRHAVNSLFRLPLILSAALLSFGYGANDVANAIGPMSAIIAAANPVTDSGQPDVPVWVMIIGVGGICLGLALFATKLGRGTAKSLSSLDQCRAFCVCLAAAMTTIGASAMGLPVSSTHIVAGAILGIGLYRELRYFRQTRLSAKARIRVDKFRDLVPGIDSREPKPGTRHRGYRRFVRREVLVNISVAWVITLPAAAAIASGLFLTFNSLSGG